MATVKTAISIQESLFDQVSDLAVELQSPRSRLFALAVAELIFRHQNRRMLEALNEVYSDVPELGEQAHREALRRQHRLLVEGQW